MSGNGDHPPPPPPSTQSSNSILLPICSREKMTDPNYMDWIQNLKMQLPYEKKSVCSR